MQNRDEHKRYKMQNQDESEKLAKHPKRQSNLKDYHCSCGEVFHSKRKLAWHKEIHAKKPKSCPHCQETFIHSGSLLRHIRRTHDKRFLPDISGENEHVECPTCKGIYVRSSLKTHMSIHDDKRKRPFKCEICNKDFSSKSNLKMHKLTHVDSSKKPFQCDECNKGFIREPDYVAHMNVHQSKKPYTCNYCGTQFNRKYNYLRHVRGHEKPETHTCEVCKKTFTRSYYLKTHMRVHTGERPFSCDICGQTSTTKSNHNKHVKRHRVLEPEC